MLIKIYAKIWPHVQYANMLEYLDSAMFNTIPTHITFKIVQPQTRIPITVLKYY